LLIRRIVKLDFGATAIDNVGWAFSVVKGVNSEDVYGGSCSFRFCDLNHYPRPFRVDDSLSIEHGGIGAFFRNGYRSVKNIGLLGHFPYLFVHSPELAEGKIDLSPHFGYLLINLSQAANGSNNAADSDEYESEIRSVCGDKQFTEIACRLAGMIVLLPLGCLLIYYYDRLASHVGRIAMFGSGVTLISVGMGLGFLPVYHRCEGDNYNDRKSHDSQLYYKKCLTDSTFCTTVSYMANVLSAEKQTAIIAALAEGSSIRSIERIAGVHRDTIMRLGVKVGKGCAMLMDSKMQDLGCNYLQLDEVWGYIGKKERHCSVDDNPEYGDVWTFCAIDSETKLVPSFKIGKRTHELANEFLQDIASRVRNRVQISTDAMNSYPDAVENAFGANVDYGQIVKVYVHDSAQHPERKYSAPSFASAYRRAIVGNPEMEFVSTSHVERLNATTRLHVKRLNRLTLAFSKKLENFQAAVALHFAYYNFVRRHNTLRCTPAMAAGVEKDFWSVGDLVEATL
jgi:IS1 family transposase